MQWRTTQEIAIAYARTSTIVAGLAAVVSTIASDSCDGRKAE